MKNHKIAINGAEVIAQNILKTVINEKIEHENFGCDTCRGGSRY